MLKHYPFYKQRDAMDCGPTCLMMVAAYHGKNYTLPYLREHCHLSREGVSAAGIEMGAEAIGLNVVTSKVPFFGDDENANLRQAPFPVIVHWNQQHFVVVYNANNSHVWIGDPASGIFKLKRRDFEKSWISDDNKGVAIIFETTPEFYNKDNPTPIDKKRFSYIFQYLRPHRWLIFQMLLGMAVVSVFNIIAPFLTQSIVDMGIQNQNIGFVTLILIAQLVIFVSQTSVSFIQNRILLSIGTRINIALMADFLIKLMRLPLSFFDAKMMGDIMQRLSDQSRIESFLTQSSLSIIFTSINFLIYSCILLFYNLTVFLVFAIAAVCYTLWIVFFMRRRKELDYKRFNQMGQNQSVIYEMIQAIQEIKLQGSEKKHRQKWATTQYQLFNISQKSLVLGQWQGAGASFFNQGKDFIITAIAAQAVIKGEMSLGQMMAMQYMVGQLNAPLQQFMSFLRSLQDAKISLERLGEIHDAPDEDDLMGSTVTPEMSKFTYEANRNQDVHLENISFKYNELNDYALKDINLTLPHGKVTAIVGTSGSGKTTLVKLLLGFYKPKKGKIKLGGINLNNISQRTWRSHCGAVMQDGFIFSNSLADNVAESEDYTDKAKLLQAVHIANIQEFIETLPYAYNTTLGSKGSGISQGQRQRLLIARAVYKDPDFLFFDEATNALDAKNEKVIVENLNAFFENRTVVVVAHRLSTVKNADQIVVMEKGEIVEIGTHPELVLLRGAYYELVKNQLELGS
jgi:ATP-binding cassette, subfamily B, bacterial